VRPGTDGALALGITKLMIERGWYDGDFISNWSNGPLLVRADTGRLLTERDLGAVGNGRRTFAWDRAEARMVPYDTATGRYDGDSSSLALEGEYRVLTAQGEVVCHPVFELLSRPSRWRSSTRPPNSPPTSSGGRLGAFNAKNVLINMW
jgi:anaerobic selenocysteine-containing dehydrogenase